MSLSAQVVDGELIQTQATSSKKASSGNGMDKEAFLQLLVAQMKYQDPLEPTSNTEYVSQYAQFSQVESLSSMSTTMDLQRASSLVGEYVYMKVTDANGNTDFVCGQVDYVSYQNGKPYLYIGEKAYELSDLDSVVDKQYQEAFQMATDLVVGINKLPALAVTSLEEREKIEELGKLFDSMNDYQKTFVAKEKQEALQAYRDKMKQLQPADEAKKVSEEENEDE